MVAWDKDHRYYQAAIKWHTSTNYSPTEIFDIGKKEVERIKKRMEAIIVNETGDPTMTIFQYSQRLKSNKSGLAKGEYDLLERHRKLIDDVVNPNLHKVFHKSEIPRVPIE